MRYFAGNVLRNAEPHVVLFVDILYGATRRPGSSSTCLASGSPQLQKSLNAMERRFLPFRKRSVLADSATRFRASGPEVHLAQRLVLSVFVTARFGFLTLITELNMIKKTKYSRSQHAQRFVETLRRGKSPSRKFLIMFNSWFHRAACFCKMFEEVVCRNKSHQQETLVFAFPGRDTRASVPEVPRHV